MKLLLQRNIESLGKAGELVEVSPGYARNCLLPQGLALEPTKGNLKRVEELRAVARQEDLRMLQEAQGKAKVLEGLELAIKARANDQGHLFGSVGPTEVAAAMKEAGFDVPEKFIILDPHIKEIGDCEVEIKFAQDASTNIKLTVFSDTPLVDADDADAQAEQPSSAQDQTDSPSDDSQ